jgi:hypothetical protein
LDTFFHRGKPELAVLLGRDFAALGLIAGPDRKKFSLAFAVYNARIDTPTMRFFVCGFGILVSCRK